jgi:peptidoglycan-N-acetylglucosamine deacetylase
VGGARFRAVALFIVVALSVLAATGSAAPATKGPFAVKSASLTQDGRHLQWTVALDHVFSGAGLRHDHRSLCLALGITRSGSASAQLCVAPPRSGRGTLRLQLDRVVDGRIRPGKTIAATIARPSASSLTASFAPSSVGLSYRSLRWQVSSALGPPVCVAAGAPCSLQYPATPALARLHTPKLVGCAARGSSLVFNGSPKRREIALAFDDGPWNDPPTIDFVNLLARYHAPATFFEIGDQISTYDRTGSVERKMLADGDMIGDHTWTHPDMVGLSPAQQTSQLQLTAAAIRRATGFTPCLWRPPYGDISGQLDSLARSLGFLTIYWDIDPRDWSLPGVAEIENNVIDNAHNGAIAEMHFGGGPRQETLAALPDIITTLRHRGYRFVTVAQMLGLRMIYR